MQVTTGIDDAPVETFHGTSLQLEQNTPNPFSGTTNVTLTTVDDGAVTLTVMDMNGRTVAATQTVETHGRASLQNGTHQFRITVANAGTYILVARQNGHAAAIKMVSNGSGADNRIEYTGTVVATPTVVKTHGRASLLAKNTKSPKLATTNPFQYGDIMEYTGYATINDEYAESERIVQMQGSSQTLELEFDVVNGDDDDNNGYIPWDSTGLNPNDAKPCPGTPTVTDFDGNVYNTVQIGKQCWMKEDIRSISLPGNLMTAWSSTSCDVGPAPARIGSLYNWQACMNKKSASEENPSGIRGICPLGWHVPSLAEWYEMRSYIRDSSYAYLCDSNKSAYAKSLASQCDWQNDTGNCTPGNDMTKNNATGFSAIPVGFCTCNSNSWYSSDHLSHYNKGFSVSFWTTNSDNNDNNKAYKVTLYNDHVNYSVNATSIRTFNSVRCVKD